MATKSPKDVRNKFPGSWVASKVANLNDLARRPKLVVAGPEAWGQACVTSQKWMALEIRQGRLHRRVDPWYRTGLACVQEMERAAYKWSPSTRWTEREYRILRQLNLGSQPEQEYPPAWKAKCHLETTRLNALKKARPIKPVHTWGAAFRRVYRQVEAQGQAGARPWGSERTAWCLAALAAERYFLAMEPAWIVRARAEVERMGNDG